MVRPTFGLLEGRGSIAGISSWKIPGAKEVKDQSLVWPQRAALHQSQQSGSYWSQNLTQSKDNFTFSDNGPKRSKIRLNIRKIIPKGENNQNNSVGLTEDDLRSSLAWKDEQMSSGVIFVSRFCV